MAEQLSVPLYDVERTAAPAKVCCTGASGFAAGPIVQRLLAAGHTVHATVRDPSNASSVAALKALPGAEERLVLFKADLLEKGSFHEAVRGCKYVVHTASPFFYPDLTDVKAKLLEPAIDGTVNVLDAVNACESVERVVLTSSVAAVNTKKQPGELLTEDDWNDIASETVAPYAYSKTLAERKAWEIANAQTRWQLVVINPVYIMGPPVGNRMDGTSMDIICEIFEGQRNDAPDATYNLVDVRDVAAAHCVAMVHPEAKGRNIVCEGRYTVAQICELLHEKWPSVKVPSAQPAPMIVDNTKIQRELGFKFLPTKTCLQDMIAKLIDIGRLSVPK